MGWKLILLVAAMLVPVVAEWRNERELGGQRDLLECLQCSGSGHWPLALKESDGLAADSQFIDAADGNRPFTGNRVLKLDTPKQAFLIMVGAQRPCHRLSKCQRQFVAVYTGSRLV